VADVEAQAEQRRVGVGEQAIDLGRRLDVRTRVGMEDRAMADAALGGPS
jgi:hypothetical protein